MQCQTCGDATSPDFNECQRCHTPLGQPAVTPGLPTYAVQGVGLAASVAVGAVTLLYLVVGLFPLVGVELARRAAVSEDADILMGAALAEAALSLPYLLVYLTAIVLVIIWTWRVRKNTDAFPGALPSLGPGWAIAGWLVPFASLVVPARVVANVARDSLWRRRTPPLVFLWWSAWLVFSCADTVVGLIDEAKYRELPETPRGADDFQAYVDYYQDGIGRHLVPTVACLVAGVSLIVLIRSISAAQQDRIARAASVWPVASVWPAAPVWPAAGTPVSPTGFAPPDPAPTAQPVTGWSPQVADDATAASPQVPPAAGGTIRA